MRARRCHRHEFWHRSGDRAPSARRRLACDRLRSGEADARSRRVLTPSRSTSPTRRRAADALDAADGVTALVHAAGIMRGRQARAARSRGGRDAVAAACRCRGRARRPAGAAPDRRRPHRADRQPCGARRDRQEPVRCSEGGACRSRAGLGEGACAARHHGERRGAGGNRDRDADRSGARRHVPPAEVPPIGRRIYPEEVAALVAFLLSDEAAAITGQEIAICGGASL